MYAPPLMLGLLLAAAPPGNDYQVTMTSKEVVIPFTTMIPLPQLSARINGKRVNLVIDTGGPGLDLSPGFARAAGIETRAAGSAVFAGGLRAAIRAGHVDRLDIGGATLRSLPIHVPPQMPPGVDGIIGTSILDRFLATIDYPRHRLVLRDRSASREFEIAAKARGDIVVSMVALRGREIFVRAQVNSAPETYYVVDTGGPGIGVDLSKTEIAAAAVEPDVLHPQMMMGGGGPTKALPFFASVNLGGKVFSHVPGVYLPEARQNGVLPFAVGGRLSQELFNRGALTFDFVAMKLVLHVPR